MRSLCHIIMFLIYILAIQRANADWSDITILQDLEISECDQYVQVFVHSPDTVTTVDVTGGEIGTLFAYDDSVINVTGGIFSPEFYSYHPENNDGDDLMLAPYRHRIYLNDKSVLNYYGADLQSIMCADQSTTNIYDGSVFLEIANKSVINVSGGEIKGITETKFFSPVQQHSSHLSIWGGSFSGTIMLMGDTVADIYGYGFEYDPDGWVFDDPRLPIIGGGRLQGFWSDGTAFSMDFSRFHFNDSYSHVVLHEIPRRIQIDIKPQSCPNPVNVKSKGVLPVAILGSDVLDVNDIDYDTILLEGIAPLRGSYEDVASPVSDDTECACTTDGADGYMDLTLKFDTQEMLSVLGEVVDDELWMLHLTGNLKDGTPIEGTDCILIKKKGKH